MGCSAEVGAGRIFGVGTWQFFILMAGKDLDSRRLAKERICCCHGIHNTWAGTAPRSSVHGPGPRRVSSRLVPHPKSWLINNSYSSHESQTKHVHRLPWELQGSEELPEAGGTWRMKKQLEKLHKFSRKAICRPAALWAVTPYKKKDATGSIAILKALSLGR